MTWRIRYRPGTDLALRFPNLRHPRVGFATREQAERVREACPNADLMESYESEESER